MTIVITEGVNRSGKTSIYDKFFKERNFAYFKDNRIKNKESLFFSATNTNDSVKISIYAQANIFEALAKVSNINIFVDRFHISEYVYSTLDRNNTFAKYLFDNIDKRLTDSNVKLLFMADDISKINERAGKDLTQYYRVFDECFGRSSMNKLKFNLNDDTKILENWYRT